jgi:hypothetical protein
MHIERTTLDTTRKLPAFLRWLPVTARKIVILSPLEVAIDTMTSKNAQLKNLIGQYSSCQPGISLNPLTMSLNGVVDPAVMGGIAKYQEVRRDAYF